MDMSTSKSSRGSKPSRITVACNSCRSRKQKVSASAFNGIIYVDRTEVQRQQVSCPNDYKAGLLIEKTDMYSMPPITQAV